MPAYSKFGVEHSVNSATVSMQHFARIATFASGGYIVVWNSIDSAQDGSSGAVKAQRFDANGEKIGTEFLVNSAATANQTSPVVTTFADGSFVVAWTTSDTLQDGSVGAIKAQLFDPSGVKVGAEFLVNTTAAGNQNAPSIVTLANGNFLVSWDDVGSTDVQGRIFSASGVALGADFRLNANVTGSQNFNDVTALADGGFVAIWRTTDSTQDGSGDSVRGQRFDSNGNRIGAEFQINTATLGAQNDPSITALAGGGFVVTWVTSWNSEDGSSAAIKAQIFDSAGAKAGAEFLVNTMAAGAQQDPVVTSLPGGGFIIAWTTFDTTQDGNGDALKAQVFDSAGARVGTEFLVNTQAAGNQSVADIATLSDGRVIVTWTDTYADGAANWGIKSQILAPDAPPPPGNSAPVIISNGGGDSAAISHNENVLLATTIASSDPDGQAPVFSIVGGADAALFTLGAQSGRLSFVAAPNFETAGDSNGDNVYEIVVASSDGELEDVQTILITILNVDEPITFTSSNNILRPETYGGGYIVSAVEPDDVTATIGYSIAGGADAGLFSIDSVTGDLRFLATPDYESPTDAGRDNVYDVVVRASDGISAATQAITFRIYDVNEAPVIGSNGGGASATVTVLENQNVATTVAAVDPDGNAVAYAITGGVDSARFTINAQTGALAFVNAPNFEAPSDANGDNDYQVVVTASAGGHSDSQALTVRVTNANEGVTLNGSQVYFDVDENTNAVTIVAATDMDSDPLSYAIAGGADAAYFTIDSATGALRFLAAPNYEAPADSDGDNLYEVIVSASDGSLSASRALTVVVQDKNDAPVITSGGGGDSFDLVVEENSFWIGSVTAVDPDPWAFPFTFSIVGGADAALFSIYSQSGALFFANIPSFESPQDSDGDNVYELVVAVSDGTNAPDTQTMRVTVTDVDERPMFVGGGTGANLFIDEGTTVVATLTAVDQDGDPVTYAISGGADAHLFTIDSATGALSLIEAADYEAPLDEGENNLLHVYVTASDGVFSTLQPVYITVSNVNEGLSITSGTAWSVAENVTAVGTVNATDADGDTPTYAIVGGADSALFAIDAATGALSFVAAPDFESPADANGDNVYELIVAASDGEFTDSRSMTVTVTNGNDHAPVISSAASFTADENGLSVGSIAATDSDGDAVGYAISGGADADLFVIDAESGELRFVSAPDFEAAGDSDGDNVYEVIVSAGDGTLSSSQAIAVTIGNVDEGVAIVSNGGAISASVSVAENGLAIATVSAVDTDGGAVTYSIAGGADALLFEIDATTGLLSFRSAPDFEGPGDSGGDNVYDVIVSASDGNFSDSQAIAVTVSNLNEAVTIISGGGGSAASLAVTENGLAVATVAAVDADGGPVAYSIAGGADALLFEIDAATGLLSFVSAPDFEAPGDSGGDNVYDVIVAASDGSFSDSQAIALTVGNVNEGVTITSGGGASAASYSVSENEMAVTIVSAVDADGTNVSYAIAGGMDAQLFAIDAATGALQFLSAPDFELPGDADGDNVYQLVVTASDGSLGDSQYLAVTVGNRNEGVSIVSNGGGAVASVWVDENSQAVGSVLALDQDGGAVVYAIAGGADAARFAIDAQTGALRFLSAPNHEAPTDSGGNNVYDVIVSASDGTFSDSQALAVNVANVREGNVIVGTSANNTISTSSSVSGQPRATELEDTIYGLGGADNISGAGGADIIDGGAGNDILTGGLGGDILTGGTGADRFTYTQAAETAPGARDLIMDFSRAEGDKIALSSIDANSKSGGNQSFAFIGTNAFSGAAGQLRYELVDGHTIVSGDVNGDRVADFQIELNAPLALVATDFIL